MNALAYVCATLKGTPPHIFAEAWLDPEHGASRMAIDIATVSEIITQINESTAKSKNKKERGNLRNRAKGVVARRNQRRKGV